MKLLKEIHKKESGQAFILVLILLLVGGLIIAPLMGFMGTGLIAGQAIEEKVNEVYAADAGIEDAIWRIQNDVSLPLDVGDDPVTYSITSGINNISPVIVTITKEGDTLSFLEDLLNENFSGVHSDWMQVTETLSPDGTYAITVTDLNSNDKFIVSIGAWIEGDYDIDGSADIELSAGMTPGDTPTFEQFPYDVGTAFIWSWKSPLKSPKFQPGDYMTLTFHIIPTEVTGLHFSFAAAISADIGVIYPAETFAIYKVTATADNTKVVSYIVRMGIVPFPVSILTWEINPPG